MFVQPLTCKDLARTNSRIAVRVHLDEAEPAETMRHRREPAAHESSSIEIAPQPTAQPSRLLLLRRRLPGDPARTGVTANSRPANAERICRVPTSTRLRAKSIACVQMQSEDCGRNGVPKLGTLARHASGTPSFGVDSGAQQTPEVGRLPIFGQRCSPTTESRPSSLDSPPETERRVDRTPNPGHGLRRQHQHDLRRRAELACCACAVHVFPELDGTNAAWQMLVHNPQHGVVSALHLWASEVLSEANDRAKSAA